MLSHIPILSLVAYIPLLGALAIVFLIPREKAATIRVGRDGGRRCSTSSSRCRSGSPSTAGEEGYQFVERASWIPSLGVEYHFGIDGISLVLILLTTLMGVIAVVCSYSAITERQKEYYVLLLLLQTFMIGTFCCLDFFLFYVFWEVMLVPMYFLIGVWGGERRLYAAIKFFLYTLAGSVLMLLGIIALYFLNTTGFLGYKGAGQRADLLDREADGGGRGPAGGAPDLALLRVLPRASRSRCRCSRSTPGCPTPIPRRRRPGPSSWRRSC